MPGLMGMGGGGGGGQQDNSQALQLAMAMMMQGGMGGQNFMRQNAQFAPLLSALLKRKKKKPQGGSTSDEVPEGMGVDDVGTAFDNDLITALLQGGGGGADTAGILASLMG